MISVVIPFGGHDIDLLNRQLARLAAQDYQGTFEIVIACNATLVSSTGLELPDRPDISVRSVDARAFRGPSFARNVGWQQAAGDHVLFCDADDEVQEGWISALAQSLQSCELAGGSLRYSEINALWLSSWHSQLQERPPTKFGHLQYVPSCNLAVRRSVLEELGGFRLDLNCGEDIDFCWRAQYAGYALCFNAGAQIDYRLRSDYAGLYKQYFAYGVSDAMLLLLHKPHGARRRLSATFMDLAAVAFAVLLAPWDRASRFKAAARLGNLVGRAFGTADKKVWAL